MGSSFTDLMASDIAVHAALLFGAQATYVAAWDNMICASGIPILSTACAAAVATTSAWGSAFPTSSEAHMMILLEMKRMSSPA